jgi:hypothetical protein
MHRSETKKADSEVISTCKDDWFFEKKRNIIEIDRKQGGAWENGQGYNVVVCGN